MKNSGVVFSPFTHGRQIRFAMLCEIESGSGCKQGSGTEPAHVPIAGTRRNPKLQERSLSPGTLGLVPMKIKSIGLY